MYDEEHQVGANVEFIGSYAFYKCSELTSVDLSNTKIREISSFAFDATPKLTKVILPNSVSQLGRSVFTTQDLNIYCRGAEFDPGNKWYDTNKNITVTWNYTGE